MERKSSTLRNFRGDAGGLQGATRGTGEEEEEEEEREKDEHERKGQSMVGEMRTTYTLVHRYCFDELAMAPVCERGCAFFFFFAAHTAPLHWQLRQHIWPPIATRERSSLGPRVRGGKKSWKRKMGRGKKEILKGDLKYAEGDRASP